MADPREGDYVSVTQEPSRIEWATAEGQSYSLGVNFYPHGEMQLDLRVLGGNQDGEFVTSNLTRRAAEALRARLEEFLVAEHNGRSGNDG